MLRTGDVFKKAFNKANTFTVNKKAFNVNFNIFFNFILLRFKFSFIFLLNNSGLLI